MRLRSFPRLLRAACIVALLAIGLMAWSLVDPRPMPVVVAMSVGQVLGTLSFGIFLAVVVVDLRRARFARPSEAPRASLHPQLGVTLAKSSSKPVRAPLTVDAGPTSLKK